MPGGLDDIEPFNDQLHLTMFNIRLVIVDRDPNIFKFSNSEYYDLS